MTKSRNRARYDKWYAAGYRSYRTTDEALAIYQEIRDRTGMNDREIVAAAGLANTKWLSRLRSGEPQRVQGEKFRRLLALRDSNPPVVRVPVIGVQRRLRGLHRMGWSTAAIRERLGFQAHFLERLEPTHLIAIETHQKIAALYDELSMIPGPSNSARVRAMHAGMAPPLAWDDDTIDDPKAKPDATGGYRQMPGYVDHAKVARRLQGDKSIRLNKFEAAEVIRVLQRRGITGYAQEHTYGLKPERY